MCLCGVKLRLITEGLALVAFECVATLDLSFRGSRLSYQSHV